jgi:hypothetical protein
MVEEPLHVKKQPLNHICKIGVKRTMSFCCPSTLSYSSVSLCGAVTVDDLPELASRAISTIAKNAAFFTCSCTEA